jgi:hypothetical protein
MRIADCWPFDRYPILRTAIVNLKSGTAFSGVIWQRRNGFLVLRNAKLLKPGGEAMPIDGEILIFVGDVEFMQVVTPCQ